MIVDVAEAAAIVREGGLVAYPTETVYGLGADPDSSAAIERLLELKGRDGRRGISVLLPERAALARRVPDLPPVADALARKHWPGPLTLVLEVGRGALAQVASERGVGFRCSPQPTAAALARATGALTSTSCNRSGEPACTTAAEVEAAFGDALAVVGGEPAGGGAPSTVVAVTREGKVELIREGAIAWDAIHKGTGRDTAA